MAAHAKLSASKMKQAKACPGSVAAQQGYPNRESKAAREGTAVHWMAEQILFGLDTSKSFGRRTTLYAGTDVRSLIGETAPNGVKLTAANARAAEVYIDEVRARAAGAEFVGIEVSLRNLETLDPDLGGTSDCVVVNRSTRTLYVGDYKNGSGVVVDPDENEQAMTYGTGALLLPAVASMLADIDTVEIFIVQPNAPGEKLVKSWRTDPMRLIEWAAELPEIAARTRDPNAPRVAGSHCQFCLAKTDCRAHYELALKSAGFDDVPDFGGFAVGAPVPLPPVPNPVTLSSEELAARLALAEHLKRWIKAVEETALQRALDGAPPVGFKAVAGRGSRTFTDAVTAIERVAEALGLPASTFYTTEPLSVAQVENTIGKKDLKALPWWSEVWTTKPGKPTLVPESDKRPALDKAAGFDEVFDFDAIP